MNANDAEYLSRTNRHWTMLTVGLTVVVLPYVLATTDAATVSFWHQDGWPLPELCSSRALFGIECPGCGLTRSVIHFAHGRWSDSWEMHRLGWLLYLGAAAQIPHRMLLLRGRRGLLNRRYSVLFGNLVIAALLLSWLCDQWCSVSGCDCAHAFSSLGF